MAAILKACRQSSNRKSDSVIRLFRFVFTWRTFLPNFSPIRFKTTEP